MTVAPRPTTEAVPLHHTLEAATLRRAGYANAIALLKLPDRQLLTDLIAFRRRHAKLAQRPRRVVEPRFLRVTQLRPRRAARAHRIEPELQRAVPGRLATADLHDRTRSRLDHRDRYRGACITEDLGHAQLASDDSCHGSTCL